MEAAQKPGDQTGPVLDRSLPWSFCPLWDMLFCSVVSLLLLASSIGHFQNPPAFYEILIKYNLFPPSMAFVIAQAVPWVQIVLAFGLLSQHRKHGFFLAFCLFLIFVVAQSVALYRGISSDCGCMGPLYPYPMGWKSLLFPLLGTVCSLGGWMAVSRLFHDPKGACNDSPRENA